MKFSLTTLSAGLLAGTLDIVCAFAFNLSVSPLVVLQAVASGILGGGAFAGGVAVAVLGLALHFLLSVAFAVVYGVLARLSRFPLDNWFQAGVVYGLMVFVIMTYVVVPMSRATIGGPPDLSLGDLWQPLLAHTVFFGLPIAFVTARGVKAGFGRGT